MSTTRGGLTPSAARGLAHQVSRPAEGFEVHLCPAEMLVDGELVPDFTVLVLGPSGPVPGMTRRGIGDEAAARAHARDCWQRIADGERC